MSCIAPLYFELYGTVSGLLKDFRNLNALSL